MGNDVGYGFWGPDLYAAAGYAARLAADYGNAYTSIRTYRSKWSNEENVKPGRLIFIDDAPAAPEIPDSARVRAQNGAGDVEEAR